MPPCGLMPPPQLFYEAELRDLAMHLVRCGCGGRIASPLLGGIATAVGNPAQGVLKAPAVASSAWPRLALDLGRQLEIDPGTVSPESIRAHRRKAHTCNAAL